ncbi:MAG: hypothetical protein ACJ74W_24295 [Pyrinomonadaceae bacterium]
MPEQARITYSGFYDAPLAFVVWHKEKQILFWRVFDETLDDFPESYKVFLLPNISDEELDKSWAQVEKLATHFLGEIPVKSVQFDSSMRKEIGTEVIDSLIESGWNEDSKQTRT